jgi:hypothetical protein
VTILRPACASKVPARIGLRFLTAVLCFVALHFCANRLSARPAPPVYQKPGQPYALIFGTVWGPDDRPLYGVPVKIRRTDQKKAHWGLVSDHSGEFAQRVPPGPADYMVWADLKGFKSASGKELRQDGEVKVHIDNDEREDIGLHLKQQ